jgi:hypothetical protein
VADREVLLQGLASGRSGTIRCVEEIFCMAMGALIGGAVMLMTAAYRRIASLPWLDPFNAYKRS